MKHFVLLVAALAMSVGVAYAQVCVEVVEDGDDLCLTATVDGDEEQVMHINVWEVGMWSYDEMGTPLCIPAGDVIDNEGGFHIEWGDGWDYFPFYEADPEPATLGDAVAAGGFGEEGCEFGGGGGEEPEEPAAPAGGLRIIDGLDYAGRAAVDDVLIIGLFDDADEEIGMEQAGWCAEAGCMDADCSYGITWGDIPEGEAEGEAEFELVNDLTDDVILGRIALTVTAEMMSVIGLAEEGNPDTAYCIEIPWPLDAPVSSGAPVAGMLGLGLVAAACALGGAVTLRKK